MIDNEIQESKRLLFKELLHDIEKFSDEHLGNIKKIMKTEESKSLLVWLLFLSKEIKRKHEGNVNYMFLAEGVYKVYTSLLSAKKTDMALERAQTEEYFVNVLSNYFDAVLEQLKIKLAIKENGE